MATRSRKALGDYEHKRDFGKTSEPSAQGGRGKKPTSPKRRREKKGSPRFVVQEHSARRLHWDLRLEHDGVAASWAIPNGIPEDPAENRKAVRTEDHPLEYLEWEGEIPAGEYGAGTMRIWDAGTYELEKWEPGKVMVEFAGERLRGRYALFRAGKSEKDWMIHRIDPPARERQPFPEHVVPMLARLSQLPRDDGRWAVEVKWDGVRAIAYCQPGRLRLQTRNLNDVTAQYPEVRRLSRQLGSRDAVLDGELVAFDENGRPSFERLQQRIHQTSESVVRRRMESHPVVYVIFDLLYLDGRHLMGEPYSRRRELLEELELGGEHWQTPGHSVGHAKELLEASREQGLEGVVLKRVDSVYAPGRRTGAWLKVKNTLRQEMVIGGWTPGEGRRSEHLGALLVGYFEDDGGRRALRYGGKVGTGFSDADLTALTARLAPLERKGSPFAAGPTPPKNARFVEPELVAEIEFREMTAEGLLRHSAYKGLREDKPASDVELERAADSQGESPGKAEPVDWYGRIGETLLPHLHGRPLTLKRHPKGANAEQFVINDMATLLSVADLGNVELHTSLSRREEMERPTAMVFDLDPGPPADILDCAEVALWLRGMLEQLGLSSYPKTSGSKGMQLYVPLNCGVTYERTKPFAKAVAETLEAKFPERVVARMAKAKRPGRVLIDWSQNDVHKTSVCVYSLRAKERPTVSTPLEWAEVEAALEAGVADALAFDHAAVLERVAAKGDLFAPLLSEEQELPSI
ncbi:MAG TPA: non-homologous end-joining DNA ligase [Solirubrobacterales bacterium]|nr:non-homologous end-joining DNA ligase [Solirubrobacterales bacterium]